MLKARASGWNLLPWLLLLPALAGCATFEHASRIEKLERTTRAYANALRWGQFEQAAGSVGIDATKQELEKLQLVRVTAYQEQGSDASPNVSEVRQVVRIEFMMENTMRVRTIEDVQQWRYDAAKGRWVLSSGFPPFFESR